jgi:hypothetical protein
MGFATAALCASLWGCGVPPGHFPVSGKVLYKGVPASGAIVYFHRQGGGPSPAIPMGIADDDGNFDLACDGVGSGCPPGHYAVLVEWKDPTGDGVVPVETKRKSKTKLVKRSRVRLGPDRLAGRYFVLGKPLLHAEVKPEANRLPTFELTD